MYMCVCVCVCVCVCLFVCVYVCVCVLTVGETLWFLFAESKKHRRST